MRNMKRWAIVLTLVIIWLTVVPADCRLRWKDICLGFLQPLSAKLASILSGHLPILK